MKDKRLETLEELERLRSKKKKKEKEICWICGGLGIDKRTYPSTDCSCSNKVDFEERNAK